jgi:hypothetical protein
MEVALESSSRLQRFILLQFPASADNNALRRNPGVEVSLPFGFVAQQKRAW